MKKYLFFVLFLPSFSWAGFQTDYLTVTGSMTTKGDVALSAPLVTLKGVVGTTVTVQAGSSSEGSAGAYLQLGPGGRGTTGGQTTFLRGSVGLGNGSLGPSSGAIWLQTMGGTFGNAGDILIIPGSNSASSGRGGIVFIRAGESGSNVPGAGVTLRGGHHWGATQPSGGVTLETGEPYGSGIYGTISISTTNLATTVLGGTVYGLKDSSFTTRMNVPILTATTSVTTPLVQASTLVVTSSITANNVPIYLGNGNTYIRGNGSGIEISALDAADIILTADLITINGTMSIDNLSVPGNIETSLIPSSDNHPGKNLGSSSLRWNTGHFGSTVTTGRLVVSTISLNNSFGITDQVIGIGSDGSRAEWRYTSRNTIGDGQGWPFVGTSRYAAGDRRWYPAGGTGQSNALGSTAPAIDTLLAVPFTLPSTSTVEAIGFYVTTAGGANSVARIGIYEACASTDPYPCRKIWDGGEQVTTSTASKKTTINWSTGTPHALYFAVYHAGVSAPTIRGFQATSGVAFFGFNNDLSSGQGVFIQVADSYGALPDTFPSGGTITTAGSTPAMFMTFGP